MNETTLQVIGCGDAFSSGGRFQTCFFVKSTSLNFLIDCGVTSAVALKRNNINTNDIDLIVITHFHGDHFGGLVFLILDAAIAAKRTKPLVILTPAGGQQKLRDAIQLFYPGLLKNVDKLNLEFIEYQSWQTIQLGALTLQAFPVIHTPETLPHAVRISVDNTIISFSGDTEWTDELVTVANNADLFICECNFFNSKSAGHLNYNTIIAHQNLLNCKNILLTHLGDEMLANLQYVELNCAEDGKIIIV